MLRVIAFFLFSALLFSAPSEEIKLNAPSEQAELVTSLEETQEASICSAFGPLVNLHQSLPDPSPCVLDRIYKFQYLGAPSSQVLWQVNSSNYNGTTVVANNTTTTSRTIYLRFTGCGYPVVTAYIDCAFGGSTTVSTTVNLICC